MKGLNLSWIYHPAHIASKISKSISIISRIRHFVWLSTLHHIYRSYIQLYSLSVLVACGNAAKIHKTKILTFQKRAPPLIYFGDCKSVAIPFFISSRLLPLDALYFKAVAVMMHVASKNSTVPNIYNLFTDQADIHPYETRSSLRWDYILKCSRIGIQKINFYQELVFGIAYLVNCARCQNPSSKIMFMISSSKDYKNMMTIFTFWKYW